MSTHTIPSLEAAVRERIGTRYAQRARKDGRLPAVIYGHGQDPLHVTLDAKAFVELLHHEAHLIDVNVDGKSDHCLVKDVQWDHLGRHIIHADLARVDLGEQVEVEVDLKLTGEAVGLKEAGTLLDQQLTSVTVRCRADSIPEHLEHAIDGLAAGESLTAGELTLPEGLALVTDPEALVAIISYARGAEEVAAEAAAGEPEVIEKGKSEEA